jgi:YVTN family beta-propeller protein
LNARRTLISAVVMVIGTIAISACGGADVKISSTRVPSIAGQNASFDNVDIDQAAHRLYAADRTNQSVDVFDISKPGARYLQSIALGSSPNGLAVAPELNRLFVGTGSGAVTVIDTNSYAILSQVSAGGASADLLDYGAARQRLYVSNSSAGTITSIDPTTNQVKAQFDVGRYQLEQPRFNPANGLVYVTSPTADTLFAVDPNDGLVKRSILLHGCQPMGMAINPTSNKALIVCRTFIMSFDLNTDATQKFTQVLGGDVVNYDAKVDRFFVGSPHITKPSVIGIFGGNPIAYYSSVVTGAQGNSAAYDETNHVVYTPDLRPDKAGVASFQLPDKPVFLPSWLSMLTAIGLIAGLVLVFGLLFLFVSRSADPARRPLPKVRAPKAEPSAATDSPQHRPATRPTTSG